MVLEFEIIGRMEVPDGIDNDTFWDTVIDFVEANHWYFGGRLDLERIHGCAYGMPEDTPTALFCQEWADFASAQGWTFDGVIRRIEDGWYIGPDGQREGEV